MGAKKLQKIQKMTQNRLYSTVFARLLFFRNNLANTVAHSHFKKIIRAQNGLFTLCSQTTPGSLHFRIAVRFLGMAPTTAHLRPVQKVFRAED